MPDVAHELAGEVGNGGEDATSNDVPLDLRKPYLDLIEPRRVGGSEVKVDSRVLSEELAHQSTLVGRKVVEDYVDLLAAPLGFDQLTQESNQLLAGVPSDRLAQDRPTTSVQGREERERAVPVVLEAMPLGTPRRQGQNGVQPVEGLDVRLLVQAEDSGVLRRVEVQPDDVRGFAFEIQGRNMLSLSLGHYTSAGQKHTVRAGHVAGRHPMRTDLELRCLPRCSALGVELDRFSYVRAVDGELDGPARKARDR